MRTAKRLPVIRNVTAYTLVYGTQMGPARLTAHEARAAVRAGRRNGATVEVHRTTDRSGTDLHVAYVRSAPGFWSGDVVTVDIYEIPTEALLAL